MEDSWSLHDQRVAWALGGLLATAGFVFLVLSYIGSVVFGLFLYYALRPIYHWLDDRLHHPNVTTWLTLLVVVLPVALVIAYAGTRLFWEVDAFLRTHDLQQLRGLLDPYLGPVLNGDVAGTGETGNLGTQVVILVRRNLNMLLSSATTTLLWLTRVFVVLTVAFYLLRGDDKIAGWARENVGDRFGIVRFFEGVDSSLTTVYTGALATVGITAGVAVVVYHAFNMVVPAAARITYPLMFGSIIGIFTLVPVVGITIVYVPYTGWLVYRSVVGTAVPIWVPFLYFLATLILVELIPDIVIRAYISKGEINMGLMVLAYLFGPAAFGWYGLFLGPLVLVLFLHFARRVFPSLIDLRDDQLVDDADVLE